jgi:hypothetical protein
LHIKAKGGNDQRRARIREESTKVRRGIITIYEKEEIKYLIFITATVLLLFTSFSKKQIAVLAKEARA